MKQVYTSIILLITMLFGALTIAQESQKNFMNYQGVARTADNVLMSSEAMTINIALKFGAANATVVYEESHAITTDANGVFSLLIGDGGPISGNYDSLPWGSAATFVTVSMNGNKIGTTEMMAVPYAISSGDADDQSAAEVAYNNATSGLTATTTQEAIDELLTSGKIDADADPTNEIQTIRFDAASNKIILTDGGEVTIPTGGTDADADPTNEIQTLIFDTGTNELSLSDGNSVTIPSGGTDADADPTNEIQYISFDAIENKIILTDGGEVTIPSGGTDADADPTNEIQDISLIGTELTISDGSTIDLAPIVPPGGTDDQNAGEVPYDNTTSGLTASDAQAAIDELASGGLVDTDNQALDLTGDILTIEDGAGSIDLSAYKDVDVTTKTGILLGDGTAISGLVGTADGQVAKWDAGTSTWKAGTDDIGGGGSGTPTGLEAIDEGNGIGWRLIGRDPNDYGNIGENAVDLSYFNELLPNGGATGEYAFATGENTRAIGDWSTSMGRQNSAEGEVSFATGFQNIASGSYSTVMGRETQATGSRSVAMNSETSATGDAATSMGFSTRANGRGSVSMGAETKADAQSTLAIGRFNVGGGHPTNWVGSDPVFEIGNGDGPGVMRANAFTVLKSGWVGIGTPTPTTKLEVIGTVRSSHLAGAGERNVVADANGDLIIGAGGGGSSLWTENGSDIHFDSGNVGIGNGSPGVEGGAGKYLTVATGTSPLNNSFASLELQGGQGSTNKTIGRVDFISNSAPGNSAISRIESRTAGSAQFKGDLAFSTKDGTNYAGSSLKERLTIKHNGNVGIGITDPTTKMHIKSNSTVTKPHIKIEEQGNDYARLELTNTVSNAVWHVAGLTNNSPGNSFLNFYFRSAAGVAKNLMAIRGDGNVYVDGSLAHSSDIRLKKDIEDLPYGLTEILQLDPKIYGWKDGRNAGSMSLGLIAQAVQTIIPEIVHEGADSEKTLSLSYTELLPVLIKAVQELKAENDSLKSELKSLAVNIENMNSDFSELKDQIETFNDRKNAVDMVTEK